MRIWVCLFFYLLSFQLSAEEITRSYAIADLEIFSYEGSGRIEIQQGEKNTFTIKGDKSLIDNTLIDINRGCLSVKPSNHSDVLEGKLIVTNLNKILLNGNVAVDIDQLNGDVLMVEMGRDGEPLVEGTIDVNRFALTMYGESRAVLRGNVKEVMIYIKGAGSFEGQELVADDAKIRIDGSGSAIINVKDVIDGW